ncbi:MAG: hypothetical protein ACOX1F_05255 [Erysipelotrichaceae bacterium]|jgi:ribonuclease J
MKTETKITFYSGLDTVGGVVMEVIYRNSRIIMEIGSTYNPDFNLYDGNVNKRNSYIKDGLWINDIPEIDGLYAEKEIGSLDLLPAEKSEIQTAVFITHLHLDHMGNMGIISNNIDVYLSKNAQIIQKALEDIGDSIFSKREVYSDIPDEIKIGEIYVKSFCLNWKSYQDYSFYIETPDLKIHYTGDIFIYGIYEDNIIKEIQFLQEKEIDILVCEGTAFLPHWLKQTTRYEKEIFPSFKPVKGVITEERLLKRTQQIINDYDGLIIFNYYHREMCHAQNWSDFAENSGRTLVFEPKSAYILNRFFNESYHVMIPDTCKEDSYPEYLTEVIKSNTIIDKKEVLNNPDKYIVQNTLENILELLDYRNIKALYLHHSGTPLGDYDPQFNKLQMILEIANITYQHIYDGKDGTFYPHAIANQLLWYVSEIQPKLLIPTHCPQRKLFGEVSKANYFLCKQNKTYIYNHQSKKLEVIK